MISLRWRLVAVALGVASVGLITANLVVFNVVRRDLNGRIDRQLQDFSGRRLLVRAISGGVGGVGGIGGIGDGSLPGLPDSPLVLPDDRSSSRRPPRSSFETYADLRDASGRLVSAPQRFSAAELGDPTLLNLPEALGAPPGTPKIFEATDSSDKPYRVIYRSLARDLRDDRAQGLVYAIPTLDRDETLDKLRRVQQIAVAATLAALALFASVLVRLGLRPLRRIENSAATIAGGDLSHRIEDVGSPSTEVGRLGASLNAMLSQIEGAFSEKERSEEQLKRFIANASHELRTPLTSIRGYAELYQRGVGRQGPVLDNSMDRIASEATRMAALVEDMLALARMNRNRSMPFTPVDLHTLVHDALSDHRAVDTTRPATATITASPWISGDPFAITQVLANLLGNARTHTPPGTHIEVTLGEDAHDAILSVRDNGPGISADDLPLLFEPFYRTDPARSRASGGAGLGLTIVAGIVEQHHGTVRVESEPDVGTTFVLRFPRIIDPTVVDPPAVPALDAVDAVDAVQPREADPRPEPHPATT